MVDMKTNAINSPYLQFVKCANRLFELGLISEEMRRLFADENDKQGIMARLPLMGSAKVKHK